MSENMYVWAIVGTIVIVMAIIGYFAEKTDFGKKELEKREKNAHAKEAKEQREKEKKQKEEEKNQKEEEKRKKEEEKKAKNKKEEKKKNAEKTEEIIQIEKELNAPFGEVKPIEEDLNAPFGEVKPIEEDLNAPLQDTPAMSLEEPNTEDVNNINIELPDINSIQNNKVTKDVKEDDDIWKF